MEGTLPRPALRGKALVLSAVLGFALIGAGLGGAFAVLVAAALCWLWRGRPIWLAAVLALALTLAFWATSCQASAATGRPGGATSPGTPR